MGLNSLNLLFQTRVFYLLWVTVAVVNLQSSSDVVVRTSKGSVRGKHVDYGSDTSQLFYGQADIFLGIPYAKPPVGELRFKRPEDTDNFDGEWDATNFRARCPQNDDPLQPFPKNLNMSEDCLYLNIFTRQASDSARHPVMVFINGGNSFTTGGTDPRHLKGTIRNFVMRDIVVVTIQYRLGALGFFTTHTQEFPPNLGMLDQVKALQWIKNEISHFGGDPEEITLCGQSDGACSVSAHTLSPISQRLFKRAILQSGSIQGCFSITPDGGMITLHTSDGLDQSINITSQMRLGPNNQSYDSQYPQSGSQLGPGQYPQQGYTQGYPYQYDTSSSQPPYYDQASNPQYNQYGQYPSTSGYGYPNNTSGYGYPNNTGGYGYPNNTGGYGYPNNTSGYGYPNNTSGYGYPSTSGYGYPSTGGYGYPSTSGYGYPSTSGYGYPSTSGYGQPYGSGSPTGSPQPYGGVTGNEYTTESPSLEGVSVTPSTASQQFAAQACNMTADQWRRGQIQQLQSCLHNLTFDVYLKVDGNRTSAWMIVRDNYFMPDSIENLAKQRPHIPIIIGTVQDEDASYAFKLVANGNATQDQGQVFNNWFADFAKKQGADGEAADKMRNIITQNYDIPDQQPTPQPFQYPSQVAEEQQYGNTGYQTNQVTLAPETTPTTTGLLHYQEFGTTRQYNGDWQSQSTTPASGNRQYDPQQGLSNVRETGPPPTQSYANASIPADADRNSVIDTLKMITKVSSDASVVSGVTKEIDMLLSHGNGNVRVFEFVHVTQIGDNRIPDVRPWQPVYQGVDVLFLWMDEEAWSDPSKVTPRDIEVANELSKRWAEFVKTGSVSNWQPTTQENYQYCQMDGAPEMQSNYGETAHKVFNELVPRAVNPEDERMTRQFENPKPAEMSWSISMSLPDLIINF